MTERVNYVQLSPNRVKAMRAFSPGERAALAWAEALPKLPDGGVSDAVYLGVKIELSEKEILDLTFGIMAVNACNRMSVAERTIPGSVDKPFGLDKAGL